MKLSYNYDELIEELKNSIKDNEYTLDEDVQVMRGDKITENYAPIIDWYYSPSRMQELLENDDDDDIAETIEIAMQYAKDCFNLEPMTVKKIT